MIPHLWQAIERRCRNRNTRSPSRRRIAAERLEPRSMLAITLPVPGDMLAGPIVLASDATVEANALTIQYDDTTNPGFVTATITAVSASGGTVVNAYWNFSAISFTGNADTDGSIENTVVLQSPYQVDVIGFGAAGIVGLPLSQTNWQVEASFASSGSVPIPDPAFLDLFNADSLTVTAGAFGATTASTIAGEFQSPTDLSVPGSMGALISLTDSSAGISDSSGLGVRTYELTLASTNGAIALDADMVTAADMVISGNTGSLTLGGTGTRSVVSAEGDVRVSSAAGPIAIVSAGVAALAGGISVTTPSTLTVSGASSSFSAPAAYVVPEPVPPDVANGLVRLRGTFGLTLPAGLAVTASRLELETAGTAPIQLNNQLNNVSVGSFKATTGGSLDITTSVPLVITDGTNTPTVEITATDVTIQAPAGLRVVDGIKASGTLVLSTHTTGSTTTPTVPVDFVVTDVGDNPLAATPFGGTLRDMVEYVNGNGLLPAATAAGITRQPMRILFDEAGSPVATGGVVTLAASLPAALKPVTLDGSLPEPPDGLGGIVGIFGSGVADTGFVLGAGSSTSVLRDAAFYGFVGAAIRVESAGNLISGLTLGGDPTGTTVVGNAIGIDVYGPAALRNVIGVGTIGVDAGNTIVGNTQAGVFVRAGANFNALYGNVIGAIDAGNGEGVYVRNSIGTIIGGTRPELANTIAGNLASGVRLTNVAAVSPAYGAQVVNNEITSNGGAGVLIEAGQRNVVGGGGADAGNVIAGNAIGVEMRSRDVVRTQGNLVVNNTITDSVFGGVSIDQGFGNLVQGNTVADSTGGSDWGVRIFRAPQGQGFSANKVFQNTISGAGDSAVNGGIVVENSSGQVVGGPGTLANVVVDNGGSGIVVVGGTGVNAARSNLIEGNLVGSDATGANRGNGFDGIRIQGSVGNVVRGNTVRFHDADDGMAGIAVRDAVPMGAISGNTIVLNTVADNDVGIRVSGGSNTAVGGRVAGLGNWVFRNAAEGILVEDSAATGDATATVIRGNMVGLATGQAVAGNGGFGIRLLSTVNTTVDMGNFVVHNGAGGIRMEGGRNAVIGSVTAGQGNVVRFNGGDGISVVEPAEPGRTENVRIAGNAVRRNAGNGITVADTAAASAATARVSGVTIGRAVATNRPDASTNTVVANGGVGVEVNGAQAVSIIGNAITGNLGGKQIELLNDANAVLLPVPQTVLAPTIVSATPRVVGQGSPQYDVRGTVTRTSTGTAPQTVWVDLYGTSTSTSEQFFLGRVAVTIRAGASEAGFRVIVGRVGARFDQIVATATVGSGTSEFSSAFGV